MKRTKVLWLILAIVITIWVIEDSHQTEPEQPPLDYSKPVFTTSYAVVCPLGLLLSPRADAQDEIRGTFFGLHFSLSDKAKELGCEELVGGLKVDAVHMRAPLDEFVQVDGTFFTTPTYLTNQSTH
ncbi:MAG: hypothetical protein ACRD33_01890 [Candidatus Acidiferrales bacterium]